MSYPIFDRSQLDVRALAEREHDFHLDEVLPLNADVRLNDSAELDAIAERVVAAYEHGKQVILMMGAHVIKTGLSRFVIDLMERGVITHVGMNGACAIHDYELALIGATTESVARYIGEGQFGLWRETGWINDIVKAGNDQGLGYAEAVGKAVAEGDFPHKAVSILAAGYRLRIPITVHVGIGYDIIHEHPNCDGAALGEASYRDFLIITESISKLQDGVLLNFGTAVMGPEVYLKALAMSRNVARQCGARIDRFATAVFDLQDLGPNVHHTPPKSESAYYFRPLKTILVRTVQDGGESFYIRDDHRATLPALHRIVVKAIQEGGKSG
ncbi:MAG: hypothetical protein JXA89_16925 [Anaerolineae bacterium]|nr:hypothetical protein [Anaerolineae bacterium]